MSDKQYTLTDPESGAALELKRYDPTIGPGEMSVQLYIVSALGPGFTASYATLIN